MSTILTQVCIHPPISSLVRRSQSKLLLFVLGITDPCGFISRAAELHWPIDSACLLLFSFPLCATFLRALRVLPSFSHFHIFTLILSLPIPKNSPNEKKLASHFHFG